MSKDYEFECLGHNSIYKYGYNYENYKRRTFKVYFSEPKEGINNETGILLLISGFGATPNSKVYSKMREEFADKYNLITIQCEYFGNKFMQENGELEFENIDLKKLESVLDDEDKMRIFGGGYFNLDELIKTKLDEEITLTVNRLQDEKLDEFNEMGLMQAIDNITATLNVMNIIYDNGYIFNTNKVMIMGHSHGSYLAYLCNVCCEGLYTHILDNSAWNRPLYFENTREISRKYGQVEVKSRYRYMVEKNYTNLGELSIERLYRNFDNKCRITIYHGITDEFLSVSEKKQIVKKIQNVKFHEINRSKIENEIFKNTNHGLGANFIKLFDVFYRKAEFLGKSDRLNFKNNIEIEGFVRIDYNEGVPTITLW